MKAKRLLLLTDVAGVLDKDSNLVAELTIEEARELIRNGTITGGMIPKIEGCIEVVEAGVEAVVIINGRVPHSVLLELLTDHGVGTLVGRRKPQAKSAQRMTAQRRSRDEARSGAAPACASSGPAGRPRRAASTTHASWIFDLDNTLYPAECNLFAEVDHRMGAFIAKHLGVPLEHARHLQKSYYRALRHDALRPHAGAQDRSARLPRIRARHRPLAAERRRRSWRPRDRALPGRSSSSPTARAATPSASPKSSACSICSKTSAISPPASSLRSPRPMPSSA